MLCKHWQERSAGSDLFAHGAAASSGQGPDITLRATLVVTRPICCQWLNFKPLQHRLSDPQHPRSILMAVQELAAAHACLMEDAKNYHVWAHRQVVVQLAGLWEAELEYAGHFIQEDVRNNSAWNQRMFALRGLDLQ